MNILVINTGSSSIKYQLFDMDGERTICKGTVERIGLANAKISHHYQAGVVEFEETIDNHEQAVALIRRMLLHQTYGIGDDVGMIGAVGHRIGHGGEKLHKPVIIDDGVMQIIRDNIGLAPIHMPHMVRGVEVFKKLMPHTPMAAVFDTAFHQTMPRKAYTYPIPYAYYEKYGIRRYGFHGTSHQFVSAKAAELLGRPLDELKIVTCHLGNGSSLAAVKNGRSVDTSMGFTPVVGLPMGTRCGDIDISIVGYLMENEGLCADDVYEILNKQSGLLGISGLSSDCRELLGQAREGHARAGLAIDVLCYSVKKLIGAYAAAMGGLHCVVFTGGIGENAAQIRRKCCEDMAFLGIRVCDEKNENGQGDRLISADGASVQTAVIRTNEELMIARETLRLVRSEQCE